MSRKHPKSQREDVMGRAGRVIDPKGKPDNFISFRMNSKSIEFTKNAKDGDAMYVVVGSGDDYRGLLKDASIIIHATDYGRFAASRKGDTITVTYWGPKRGKERSECERCVLERLPENNFRIVSSETGTYYPQGVRYHSLDRPGLPDRMQAYSNGFFTALNGVLNKKDK